MSRKKHLQKQESFDIDEVIETVLGKKVSNCHMNAIVSFNEAFKEGNEIFKSQYFSALLEIYKKKDTLGINEKSELGKILVSLLQLQIGALSENLKRRINDNLFLKKDDEIDLFDDLGEIIRLNYQTTGLTGMEYLLENKKSSTTDDRGKILRFAQNIIESVYSSVLDYKSLIDSNWHYLYCPKEEWGKFCKISIFLLTVRNYIMQQLDGVDISTNKGYYDDLFKYISDKKLISSAISTTNYNDFIEEIVCKKITYLNGSVKQWYDPYLNKIGLRENFDKEEKHFLVPLMFTQSGTKPMTSIHKSIEYVDMYKEWKESNGIAVVGFGFNPDDEHINGIMRILIDEDNKNLYVVSIDRENEDIIQRRVADRLKIINKNNIIIVKVDEERKSDGKLWLDKIID